MAFLYRPTLRPASFCTLPRNLKWEYAEAPHQGAHLRQDIPRSIHTFGVIKTEARISAEDCETFDLKPLEETPR